MPALQLVEITHSSYFRQTLRTKLHISLILTQLCLNCHLSPHLLACLNYLEMLFQLLPHISDNLPSNVPNFGFGCRLEGSRGEYSQMDELLLIILEVFDRALSLQDKLFPIWLFTLLHHFVQLLLSVNVLLDVLCFLFLLFLGHSFLLLRRHLCDEVQFLQQNLTLSQCLFYFLFLFVLPNPFLLHNRLILYFGNLRLFLFLIHSTLGSIEQSCSFILSEGFLSFPLHFINTLFLQFTLMLPEMHIELILRLEVLTAHVAFDRLRQSQGLL